MHTNSRGVFAVVLQRLKLRKLLHEYHSSAGDRKPRAAVPATVNEDKRLNATGITAWFLQAGYREMEGVTVDTLQRVIDNLMRHSPDGMLTVRDLRDWYRTVHSAPAASDSAAGTDDARSSAPSSRVGSVAGAGSGAGGAGSGGRRRKKKLRKKPLYAWEKKALKEAKREAGVAPSDTSDSEAESRPPLGLPGDVVEFQVRLTEKEFKRFILLKRRAEAEEKYLRRAKKNIDISKRRAKRVAEERGATGIAVSGPYVEPSTLEEYMLRQDDPQKWVGKPMS